jgi:hypothetical protein
MVLHNTTWKCSNRADRILNKVRSCIDGDTAAYSTTLQLHSCYAGSAYSKIWQNVTKPGRLQTHHNRCGATMHSSTSSGGSEQRTLYYFCSCQLLCCSSCRAPTACVLPPLYPSCAAPKMLFTTTNLIQHCALYSTCDTAQLPAL